MAHYELWLHDPGGRRVELMDRHNGFAYQSLIGGVGRCYVDYSFEALPPYIKPGDPLVDWQLHYWRIPDGFKRADISRPDHVGLINKYTWKLNRGRRTVRIWGSEPNELLKRRRLPFTYKAANSSFSGYADNLIKAAVRENLAKVGLLTADEAARSLTDWGLIVEQDTSAAPQVKGEFPYDRLIQVCQELALMAEAKGDEVFFGVDLSGYSAGKPQFIFRTRQGQWGADRSTGNDKVIFYEKDMTDAVYEVDASEEENTIYLVGNGGNEQLKATKEMRQFSTASPTARREGFTMHRLSSDQDTADDTAVMIAYSRKRQYIMKADLGDSLDNPYQERWNVGDRVLVSMFGVQTSEVIRGRLLTRDSEGAENISAYFSKFGDLPEQKQAKRMAELARDIERLKVEAMADKFKGYGLAAAFTTTRLPTTGDWGMGTDTNRVYMNQNGVIRNWATGT